MQKTNSNITIIWLFFLLNVAIVTLFIFLLGNYFYNKYITLEYSKVWWKENYELLNKAQYLQLKEQLPQIKQFVEKNNNEAENTKTTNWTINNKNETKNQLSLFIMSYCPFWEIATKQLPSIMKKLKNDWTQFDIHYIAKKTWTDNKLESFESLHWLEEVKENVRQLCIKKNYWVDKLVSYMQERYKNADNRGQVSEGPDLAYKTNWIDSKKIWDCVTNWEWAKLLEEDIKIAEAENISGSPTWIANNKFQFGWIKSSDILAEFCKNNWDLAGCKDPTIKESQNTLSDQWTPNCGVK